MAEEVDVPAHAATLAMAMWYFGPCPDCPAVLTFQRLGACWMFTLMHSPTCPQTK